MRPKAYRLREREAGQSRPRQHQQDPQERQAHRHLRAEQDRHDPQHERQHPHQQSLSREIALEQRGDDVGEHRGACQVEGDKIQRIFQVDEQAQEKQAEVRRAKGQQESWQELRQFGMGQTQVATHHDIIAADDDQAGQGEIDHREEALPPGDHHRVLIRVGRRRLGEDVERVVHDGPDHGLQRTHDLLCHPLGSILQPAGGVKRIETHCRWSVCVCTPIGGGSSTQADLKRKTVPDNKTRLAGCSLLP